MTVTSSPSSENYRTLLARDDSKKSIRDNATSRVSGWVWSPLLSGFPLKAPNFWVRSFCSSRVISCARRKTTPRWATRMAKSRIKSSELGAFRSSVNWMPCLNSVPMTRVTSNFSYLSRAPEYFGGVANLLRADSSLIVRVLGRVSVMSEAAVVVVVDMMDTLNEG